LIEKKNKGRLPLCASKQLVSRKPLLSACFKFQEVGITTEVIDIHPESAGGFVGFYRGF
jgi:hypothetical protein